MRKSKYSYTLYGGDLPIAFTANTKTVNNVWKFKHFATMVVFNLNEIFIGLHKQVELGHDIQNMVLKLNCLLLSVSKITYPLGSLGNNKENTTGP